MAKSVYMIENGNVFSTSYPEYHLQAERLSQSEGKRLYREQSIKQLLEMVKPKDTIYTNIVSVSSSGMSRSIKCFIVQDDRIVDISGYVATITDNKWSDKNGGVIVSGCGMDMAFHLVYSLGRCLWSDGTKESHSTRNGEPDFDGGYALKHSTL